MVGAGTGRRMTRLDGRAASRPELGIPALIFALNAALDEDYWAARAQVAETCGEEVGHEEAMRMLTERLTREK